MSNQATKYHPILFSTPMVQAILEGRKTQTRRTKGLEKVNTDWRPWKFVDFCSNPESENDNRKHAIFTCFTDTWFSVPCPYEVGDVLWVREKFAPKEIHDEPPGDKVHYFEKDCFAAEKWKPSIFMPKEACRIFLKIKSIRVERLQDINEEDAIAEGVEKIADYGSTGYRLYTEPEASYTDIDAVYSFESLWQSIKGKESWKENPYVFAYKFEKIEKPLDFIV